MNLREYLDKREISQSEFADMIGVTKQAVSKYLSGERSPKTPVAMKIQKITHGNVSMEELMEYFQNKKKK